MLGFLKFVFYFIGVIAIIWEFYKISNSKKTHISIKNLALKNGNNLTSNEKTLSFFIVCYLFWGLIGLFSSQWYLFLLLILLSFIPRKHFVATFIDGLISFIILIFIILNAYHFKLNLIELFFGF